jgi:hypothetical protein
VFSFADPDSINLSAMQLCAILLSPIGLLATLLAPMAWPPRRVSRLEPSFAESTTVGSISPFENANDNLLDSSVLHKAAAATESAALRPIVFENADDSILDSIILYGSSSADGFYAARNLRALVLVVPQLIIYVLSILLGGVASAAAFIILPLTFSWWVQLCARKHLIRSIEFMGSKELHVRSLSEEFFCDVRCLKMEVDSSNRRENFTCTVAVWDGTKTAFGPVAITYDTIMQLEVIEKRLGLNLMAMSGNAKKALLNLKAYS